MNPNLKALLGLALAVAWIGLRFWLRSKGLG
jgi:hypothetical protein